MERENIELWVINADGSGKKQLTNNTAADIFPSVTADNRYIIFESGGRMGHLENESRWQQSDRDIEQHRALLSESDAGFALDSLFKSVTGDAHLWKIPIEGGTPIQLTDKIAFGHTISPDGKSIAYFTRSPEFNAPLQIEIISIEGGAPIKTFTAPTDTRVLRWSPDSRALNYLQTKNGVTNIWSLPINGGQPKQLTDWKSDHIFWFEWSGESKILACSRGTFATDLVLIENFK